jgi:hypothetical protein
VTDFSQILPVPEGDPLRLDQAGAQLATQAGNMAQHSERFKAEGTGIAQHWDSPQAASRATAQVDTLHRSSADLSKRLGSAGKAAQAYAEALRAAQLKARQLQFQAAEAERAAAAEANRQAQQSQDPNTFSRVFQQQFDPALQRLQKEHQAMRADLDQAAKTCAQALHDLSPTTAAATSLGGATAVAQDLAQHPHEEKLTQLGGGGPDGLLPPPAGTDPKKTAAWWAELTDEEKQAVVDTSHRQLGNLSGIPAAGRSAANEVTLAEDLKSPDAVVRKNAEQVRTALTNARQTIDPVSKQAIPAQLWAYDPAAYGGDGRAAISVGDMDKAKNVAMIVPGITTTVDSQMVHTTSQAANVYEEARKAAPGASTAVVAWIGYDAPSGWGIAPETALRDKAEDGAKVLAGDVATLRAERSPDDPLHLTVLSHSYGTVTAALAVTQEGMKVDEFVAVGSPGLPVLSGASLGGARVWAGANSQDIVAKLERFGPDPASSIFLSARRFEAETAGVNINPIEGHLHYFDPRSESLFSMSNITVGHYDKVLDVTGARLPGLDSELLRTPTEHTN